jgi:hypothetical protein
MRTIAGSIIMLAVSICVLSICIMASANVAAGWVPLAGTEFLIFLTCTLFVVGMYVLFTKDKPG